MIFNQKMLIIYNKNLSNKTYNQYLANKLLGMESSVVANILFPSILMYKNFKIRLFKLKSPDKKKTIDKKKD